MKRIAVSIVLLTVVIAPAVAAERGKLAAVIVEKGPAVDGSLTDPVWAKCPPLTLGKCTSAQAQSPATTARVLFDATTLYVAFECAEADTAALAAAVTDRDGPVWQDDSVELFVSGDLRTGYYHFAVNPKGVLMDTRSAGGKKDDAAYNTAAVVKASVRKGKGWVVTIAVPLKEIGAVVGEGQKWPMNLYRTRPARGGKAATEWSWAVMATNDYHSVSDFGVVTGVDVPERKDGVTRKASTPPKLPGFEKGEKKGDVIVYRHERQVDIPDKGTGTAWVMDLKIRQSKGLKVGFRARGVGGVKTAAFNMMDASSRDNTTSFAYRTVGERWRPILYFPDRFRYNSNLNRVSNNVEYTNIRFHGRSAGGKGVLHLGDFTIYRGEDATPPTAPTGLTVKAGNDGLALSWKPAADNVGIGLYVVSRAGADGQFVKIAETGVEAYLDRPAVAGTYTYRVLAADFQDNLSPWSATASAKAANAFKPPKLDAIESKLVGDRAVYAEHIRKIAAAGAGKVRKGWVFQFGDSLTGATSYRTACEGYLGRYRVEATGRAGWRTGQGRTVIEADLDKQNPQICLILYGTNNRKRPDDVKRAMADLLSMAAACEKRGVIPVFGTIPPRGFKDPASKPEAGYNAALIETMRKAKLPVAYLFEEFQSKPDRRKLLSGDGVHWAGEGFPTTGRVWQRVIDQVSFVLLDRP